MVEREAWCGTGVRSCAHWLNFHCGIGESAGREKVRVATRLGSLPNIDAAFSRGELSFSMVRAMTRVATPENEDSLLNIGRHGTASHMEQVVRKYRRVKSSLEDSAEQTQRRNRSLSYHRDTDGSWVIRGRLPAEEGALVIKAIEAVAKPEQLEEQKAIMEKREQARTGADPSAETFAEQVEREAPEQFAKVMDHTTRVSIRWGAALRGQFFRISFSILRRRFSSFSRRISACSGVSFPLPRNACPSSDWNSLIQRCNTLLLISRLFAASVTVYP